MLFVSSDPSEVSNTDDLGKPRLCDATSTELLDQLTSDADFERRLQNLDWVWVVREANAKTVLEEGWCIQPNAAWSA
jgi:hypothetical protein